MKKGISLKLFILLNAALLLFFTSAQAQESYQFEGLAVYHANEDDADIEVKVTGIGGIFHFSPVNTSGHPLAEAAFMERVGKVEVQAGIGEIENDTGLDGDITRIVANVEYMRANSPIFIEALVDRMTVELNSPADGDMVTDSYGLGGGWFIEDGLRVGVAYMHEEADVDITAPMVLDRTTDYDTFSINGKYLKELGGGKAFNAEASINIVEYDDEIADGANRVISLAGDYYFNTKLSLGAGIAVNSGDDESEEGDSLELRFNNFFTPCFYIDINYEKFTADDDAQGDDEDSLDVTLAFRF